MNRVRCVNNRSFKYILSAVDVFSRFLFTRPLQNKSAKEVALALESIFIGYGYPDIVQSDRRPEFMGSVRRLLEKHDVKVVKSRPYHSQSHGKVERQNRTIKKKLLVEAIKNRRLGFNWVGLPARCCILYKRATEKGFLSTILRSTFTTAKEMTFLQMK